MFRRSLMIGAAVVALVYVAALPGELYAQRGRGGFRGGMVPQMGRFSPRFGGFNAGMNRRFFDSRFGGMSRGFGMGSGFRGFGRGSDRRFMDRGFKRFDRFGGFGRDSDRRFLHPLERLGL
jgi:hypothetical protein